MALHFIDNRLRFTYHEGMENPPEGEQKHINPGPPDHQPDAGGIQHEAPAPLAQVPPAPPVQAGPVFPAAAPVTAAAAPAAAAQHVNNAGTLILQWLTYAFWGWSILILSMLTTSVFYRLITGDDPGTFNYYVIAALVVLLPISFACDLIYSKKEPAKKTGGSSIIMVIHAVIFALFTIGSLLFAAWSVVSLATDDIDRSGTVAGLCSAIVIGLFYAAAFMRTLNPVHVSWVPKVYRFAMLGIIVLFAIFGFAKPTFSSESGGSFDFESNTSRSSQSSPAADTFDSKGKLQPSVVGGTQCSAGPLSDNSSYGQVAIAKGADCTTAEAVIDAAAGKNGQGYTAAGYTCTPTKQGPGTEWSDYWNDDFYSYTCSKGGDQIAFNWQSEAQSRNIYNTDYNY